jgi:hypothetical protein
MAKSGYVRWYNRDRKEYFAVVSRAGFTRKAREFAGENGVLLFDLGDVGRVMS